MLSWKSIGLVDFAYFISTPLTNVARARDGEIGSRVNLELQELMIQSGGWSPQYALAGVPMTYWPFTKDKVDGGMSAQAYIDEEMKQRAIRWDNYKKGAAAGDRYLCDAFELLFTVPVLKANPQYDELVAKAVDGIVPEKGKRKPTEDQIAEAIKDIPKEVPDGDKRELIQLTLDNAYWVNSGHQRTEFVFLPTVAFWLKLKASGGMIQIGKNEDGSPITQEHDVFDFELKVPTVAPKDLNFTMEDILRDQIGINIGNEKQLRLGILDYVKAAMLAIGSPLLPAPKMSETKFRDMCAETAIAGVTGNRGQASRRAYLIAEVNRQFNGRPGLAKRLFASPKVEDKATKKLVDNPDYIDIAELDLGHPVPLCNIAVVARVVEPTLEKLKNYWKTNGPLSKAAEKDPSADKTSAIEKTIYERQKSWTEVELENWVLGRCKGAPEGIRLPTKLEVTTTEKKPTEALKSLETIMGSNSATEFLRDVISEQLGKPKAAGESVVEGATAKVNLLGPIMNGVYQLNTEDAIQEKFRETLEQVFGLKDGNPPAFEAVVTGFNNLVADALVKQARATLDKAAEAAKTEAEGEAPVVGSASSTTEAEATEEQTA